jgi:hypothetical protein
MTPEPAGRRPLACRGWQAVPEVTRTGLDYLDCPRIRAALLRTGVVRRRSGISPSTREYLGTEKSILGEISC